jgi:adhesin transport system membrane fusion protein
MFGYSKAEMLNKKVTELIEHNDLEKFIHGCEYVSSGKNTWGTEISVLDINFNVIHTNIFIYPTFKGGVFDGFIFIVEDISKDILLHQLRRKVAEMEKYNEATVDFFTSTTAAVLNTISYKISLVVKVVVGFIILFLLYAYNFEIDELAKGSGKFIPLSKVKHLKHLEGGVITGIFVKEGDIVKEGQVLVTLDPIQYQTKFNENKKRILQLKAKLARLKAEYSNTKLQEIKCEDSNCDSKVIENEIKLYYSDLQELNKNISKQLEQLAAQESALKDARNKYKTAKENYYSLKEEYDAKKELLKQKVFSLYEIKTLKRDLNKAYSDMKSAKESIAQTKSKIKEIKNSIEETKLIFRNKAANEHNNALAELNGLEEQQKNLQDIIKRTVVRSPVDGTINELFVHTIGTSIAPGTEILNIVPDSKQLVAEVKISPTDIGKLHIGQEVELKVTAYDYSIYGDLKGKIVNISPDTITDPNDRKEYYLIYVKTKTNYLDNNEKYKVKVGMKVNASVVVGKKTIMAYLLKPILKTVQKD